MTIAEYCDAAYAIIIDDYQRRGLDVHSALDELRAWAKDVSEEEDATYEKLVVEHRAELDEHTVAVRNAQAMEGIDAMMAGYA